jgi:hypothetical protein
MNRLQNYIERFIISEIKTNGFIYLSDELLFTNEFIEKFLEDKSFAFKYTSSKKVSERIPILESAVLFIEYDQTTFVNDESGRQDVIAILEYQIFLDSQGYDNRYKKKVRQLFLNFIKNNFSYLSVERERYIYDSQKTKIKFIESITDFINSTSKNFGKFESVFYRGHANLMWDPIPSIYRNNWYKSEHKMFREIIIRNSEEFQNTKSTFEKLTIMQHYGLPTRLLDITKNPLVALYFACCDKVQIQNPGEILIFFPDEKLIKYYDSDTVSMLSNLSKCERDLETNMNKHDFNNSYFQGLKLLHLIKEEKPYFLNEMNPSDFNSALIVKPIHNNARIKKQFGYFFLFGIQNTIDKPAEINSLYKVGSLRMRYFIDENDKLQILNDLESLGITSETLFPEIENGTEYLKLKY